MIYGIVGHAKAGKSTLGDVFKSDGFKKISFADPLKASLSVALNLPLELFYDSEKKEVPLKEMFDLTPRYLMQSIGTEGYRHLVHPDVWCHVLKTTIWGQPGQLDWYIDDVRMANEFDTVLALGGKMLGVRREGYACRFNHQSEIEIESLLDRCEVVIANDGSIEDLQWKMRRLLK